MSIIFILIILFCELYNYVLCRERGRGREGKMHLINVTIIHNVGAFVDTLS